MDSLETALTENKMNYMRELDRANMQIADMEST